MSENFPTALLGALEAWGQPATTVLGEISHGGLAGRAWRGERAGQPVVLKLVFDRPRFVVPGLLVSAALAARGLRTGPPILSVDGGVGVEVWGSEMQAWTLAMLRFEPGRPLELASPRAPLVGADLLVRVHRLVLSTGLPVVRARILDWFDGYLSTSSPARASLSRVRAMSAQLTEAVIYGDPSPEILVARGRRPALIDWGTPSWGPLMHDVAAWALHLSHGDVRVFGRFVDRYRRAALLAATEYEVLPDCVRLVRSLVADGPNM